MKTSALFVGTFKLGFRMVRLYGMPDDSSGKVLIIPEDKGTPQIFIGFDNSWPEVLETLLHEAYELSLIDLNTRWSTSPSYSSSASEYMFVATHEQLGEIHARMGFFLAGVYPELNVCYHENIEEVLDKQGRKAYKLRKKGRRK